MDFASHYSTLLSTNPLGLGYNDDNDDTRLAQVPILAALGDDCVRLMYMAGISKGNVCKDPKWGLFGHARDPGLRINCTSHKGTHCAPAITGPAPAISLD